MRILSDEKLSHTDMLVLALEENGSELPYFSGCHVYPVFPGEASKCVSKTRVYPFYSRVLTLFAESQHWVPFRAVHKYHVTRYVFLEGTVYI